MENPRAAGAADSADLVSDGVRERPRAESEARFLRRVGTPERLVGPVVSDERAAEELSGLLRFARELRASVSRSATAR